MQTQRETSNFFKHPQFYYFKETTNKGSSKEITTHMSVNKVPYVMTLSKQTSPLTFHLSVPFLLSHLDWTCGLALPRGTLKTSIYIFGRGTEKKEERKSHWERWRCIRACNKQAHVPWYMIHTHCSMWVPDGHTHIAQWECWGTNDNAILLTDMPKHTTCNHFKDVFLSMSMSGCFKQMSDLTESV